MTWSPCLLLSSGIRLTFWNLKCLVAQRLLAVFSMITASHDFHKIIYFNIYSIDTYIAIILYNLQSTPFPFQFKTTFCMMLFLLCCFLFIFLIYKATKTKQFQKSMNYYLLLIFYTLCGEICTLFLLICCLQPPGKTLLCLQKLRIK